MAITNAQIDHLQARMKRNRVIAKFLFWAAIIALLLQLAHDNGWFSTVPLTRSISLD